MLAREGVFMLSVVENLWRREDFAFVIECLARENRWKNNQHGDFPTREEVEKVAENPNLLREQVEHCLPAIIPSRSAFSDFTEPSDAIVI
jgi:hypothetical protein